MPKGWREGFNQTRTRFADSTEVPFEAVARCREILGEHPRLTDYRNEIGVTHPPRDDVNVEVISYSSARCLAEVHANVESVRVIFAAQCYLGSFCQLKHFPCGLLIERGEGRGVLVGNNHQVTARVWEHV